jgi:hypothetical protein
MDTTPVKRIILESNSEICKYMKNNERYNSEEKRYFNRPFANFRV